MNRDPDRMAFTAFCLLYTVAIPAVAFTAERSVLAAAVLAGVIAVTIYLTVDQLP